MLYPISRTLRAGCALVALGLPGVAFAADPPEPAAIGLAPTEPETASQLDEVVVTARRAAASINGVSIEPLRLPQNTRVLDAGLIEDLGATRLDDLIDLSGSLSRQNSFGGLWDNYAIRGFSGDVNGGPDLLINRFNSNRGFNAQRDVATIDLFQVLKGPAGALSGKGEPGGSINIVTKAPLDAAHASVSAEAGSYDHRRAVIDFGGPLSEAWATRLIVVRQEDGSFRDSVTTDRLLVAPSLAYHPADGLSLLYQAEYSLVHAPLDRGVVAVERIAGSGVLDGTVLPPERYLGEPGRDDTRLESFQHQGSFVARLSDGIALEGGVAWRKGTLFGAASEPTALIGDVVRRRRLLRDNAFDDLSGRLELSARGEALGLGHQARIGVDAYDYTLDSRGDRFVGNALIPFGLNIYNPVYGQPLPTLAPQSNTTERQRGTAIYAQDLMTLGDHWSLLLGIRRDTIHQMVRNNLRNTEVEQEPSVTSPRAALTYKVNDAWSAYVSWGRSFRFNQGVDVNSAAFAPERGRVWEGGVKYALFDGALNGTVSAFDIEKENVLASDPANAGYSAAIGRARSRGVEADVNLRLSRQLDLTGVYALVDTEVLKDRGSGAQAIPAGTELSNIPRQSGSLFAQWRSSEAESGFYSLGAGVTYVGEREGTPAGTATVNSGSGARSATFRLPDYVIARASAGYQFTPRLSGRIEVDNLFDEHYLASSYSELWITPGSPRTVRIGLKADF
ncbi:Metal-pseudopaline receptor CntO [Brevundimonas sp. NIBR10]|uniref:TonB-dependent siderophore receptor n=1 Tax=Brevundimonas sp. NIBR10 TaxID=3015997 RepID=UPI0022F1A4C1|nr:TonB-dependent siderophore receptor [Brevundimonas sp. NIBR10]WGM45915.1 Metal-pseudopaline receptor CntO [Brevundimonas sp. NIBR10]